MRDSDTISRQGGDEFLLILRDVADAHAVAHLAEKLQEVVAGAGTRSASTNCISPQHRHQHVPGRRH